MTTLVSLTVILKVECIVMILHKSYLYKQYVIGHHAHHFKETWYRKFEQVLYHL